MKLTLHSVICLSIFLLPLCVQSKRLDDHSLNNEKFYAKEVDTSTSESTPDEQPTEGNMDEQVDPPSDNTVIEGETKDEPVDSVTDSPAPAPVDDETTGGKKDEPVNSATDSPAPAPVDDGNTDEKEDESSDSPSDNTQDPDPNTPESEESSEKTPEKEEEETTDAPATKPDSEDAEKTSEKGQDEATESSSTESKTDSTTETQTETAKDEETTTSSVVQPDGDKTIELTFKQKLKYLMSPKKPWIYLIAGLVGFILISSLIFGFSRFFADTEESDEYNVSASADNGQRNSRVQSIAMDYYKQATRVQID